MKMNCRHKILIILFSLLGVITGNLMAQDTGEVPVNLGLKYYLPENKVPFIKVITNRKIGRQFEAVKGVTVNVYFGEATGDRLMGKVITAANGEARVAFPSSLKSGWDSLDVFTIVAESVPAAKEEQLNAELTVKKAILVLDTTNEDGVRTVTAQLKEKRADEWVAIPEIEMKLKIKRLLGNLTVGEEEIYTADENGTASSAFLKDSMPGDEKGNLILVARVEDNDDYGNLAIEKKVPWGKPVSANAQVWKRTLWATGNRAPFWLIALAVSITVGVWGTLFYLVKQMFKIRKMGKILDAETAE